MKLNEERGRVVYRVVCISTCFESMTAYALSSGTIDVNTDGNVFLE